MLTSYNLVYKRNIEIISYFYEYKSTTKAVDKRKPGIKTICFVKEKNVGTICTAVTFQRHGTAFCRNICNDKCACGEIQLFSVMFSRARVCVPHKFSLFCRLCRTNGLNTKCNTRLLRACHSCVYVLRTAYEIILSR